LAILAEKTRAFRCGDDVDLAATRSSVVSALTFVAVKGVAGKAVFLAVSAYVYDNFRVTTLDATNPVVWLLVFIIRDLVYYGEHRAEHRLRALWASHMIHHSPETIGATTAIRLPWMEALYKPWFSLWMPLIGFDPVLSIALDAVAAIVSIWQHSPRARAPRPVGWLVVTPSAHRVHHGSNAEYLDRNFGAVLIVWDRLFGTYEAEVARVRFGITSTKLDSTRDVLTGGYPALRADLRQCRSLRAKALVLTAAP
jgi:sterol desaturase/sphingolipid hydroxylase (fatty acid hydroxylase superfamily)